MPQEEVILVNEQDLPVGVLEKMEAHRKALLHRAFSVFIFNSKGEMLLQQRAANKYHSPGLWTNACCSHPRPGEDTQHAARRRLQEELGFVTNLTEIFSFTYKTVFQNGLTEHEFDHVFAGIYEGTIAANPEEVGNYAYMPMREIQSNLSTRPADYTSWFHIALPMIENWLKTNSNPEFSYFQ